jgi:hypothetical protein
MQYQNPSINRVIVAETPKVLIDKNTPMLPVKYYWQDNGCEAVWDDKKGGLRRDDGIGSSGVVALDISASKKNQLSLFN